MLKTKGCSIELSPIVLFREKLLCTSLNKNHGTYYQFSIILFANP